MNRVVLFALGIVLFACEYPAVGQMGGYYPKGGPDLDAQDVSLIQLIATPQAFDKKRVKITGFLHLEFEGNAIYFHSEDFQYGLTKNALWIDVPRDMTQQQKELVNNQYVICTARFDANMHGHMGMNSGELTDVTRLEVWAPHPRTIQK